MLLVMVTGVEGAKASDVMAGAHLQSLQLQVLEESRGKIKICVCLKHGEKDDQEFNSESSASNLLLIQIPKWNM